MISLNLSIATLKRLVLFVLLGSLNHLAVGQDFAWWNTTHNWDGTTPWHKYLTISPAFLGPNALPVPTIKKGKSLDKARLILGADLHYGSGDQTQNLYTELYIPLHSPKVGLLVSVIPLERYQMDATTRDLRAARDFDGKGYAGGDFYVGTYIQLLEGHHSLPDAMLTVNIKTASGRNLEAARFTDTPGYFFDLSLGKSYRSRISWIDQIRPHLMAGLFVWQTYEDKHRQNDSFLYGAGVDISSSSFELSQAIGGYYGYKNNGDRPIVYRTTWRTKWASRVNYEVQFQEGLRDYPFRSIRVLGILTL